MSEVAPQAVREAVRIINADCLAAMREMPDASVDAIVTDPPYELGFMGKSWDASGITFSRVYQVVHAPRR